MNRKLTRAGVLLALTFIFQSLRMIVPLPAFLSTILIGSLVNACLLIGAETIGWWPALTIAVAAPIVAYFQQALPFPVLIAPIAAGNAIYISLYLFIRPQSRWPPNRRAGRWPAIGLAAAGKAFFLYEAFRWLLAFIAVPAKIAAALMAVMSWPQFITAVSGGIIALFIAKRLKKI